MFLALSGRLAPSGQQPVSMSPQLSLEPLHSLDFPGLPNLPNLNLLNLNLLNLGLLNSQSAHYWPPAVREWL